jgi:hypothetical protein
VTYLITPSSLWQGNEVAGSRWTAEQLTVLSRAGIKDPENVATATVLRRPAYNQEDWTMPAQPVPHVVPRLAVTRDRRRAKVVTPAGATQWLDVVHHG